MTESNGKKDQQTLCDKILSQALQIAEDQDWETIRFADIAEALDIGLTEIYACYNQKDDLTDALLNRADQAMLSHCTEQDFHGVALKLRVRTGILAWLEALSPYRMTLRQMLRYKLEFGHVHLQVGGLLRLSRTVQWLREATLCDARDMHRIVEEIGLSTIFSMTFVYWLYDNSTEYENTREKLDALLHRAENAMGKLQFLFPGEQ